MPLEQQIDTLLNVILLLIAAVLGLCCYITAAPPYEWPNWAPKRPDETCKLHMRPRSQCRPEEHEESE